MSEIVVIKSSNQVGVVRAVLLNNETGEEILEVQPIGRAHGFNRFVKRADVETAQDSQVQRYIINTAMLQLSEIINSIAGVSGTGVCAVYDAYAVLDSADIASNMGDGNAHKPTT